MVCFLLLLLLLLLLFGLMLMLDTVLRKGSIFILPVPASVLVSRLRRAFFGCQPLLPYERVLQLALSPNPPKRPFVCTVDRETASIATGGWVGPAICCFFFFLTRP